MPEVKRRDDLEQILFGLIRKTAGCESVEGVTILDVPDNGTNWKPSFAMDGPDVAPHGAMQVARAVQLRYRCIFPS